MAFSHSKAAFGALVLSMAAAVLPAQTPITLTVEDRWGAALPNAAISRDGLQVGRTQANGRAIFACAAPCRVRVEADGFVARDADVSDGAILRLDPAGATEDVSVTAYRTPIGELQSPVTTRLLSQAALASTAAITLDGQIRQLPGVELFRRSGSLVANPTSQGISLRGLGSTSASRTLVVLDDVPQNDPVGGWIHWLEQPALAVNAVELARGGASDLYGSSAIGGVVNERLVQPAANSAEFSAGYGGQGTYRESMLGQVQSRPWAGLMAADILGTDGYIQEAPWQRGPVDIASSAHAQNGLVVAEHDAGPLLLLARLSGFNESRGNGTPYQINGTRLWRYALGSDWRAARGGLLTVRAYGAAEHYHQTFSSISNLPNFGDPDCSYRCGEVPTRMTTVPDNELGAAAHYSLPAGAEWLFLLGADVRDVRVWDGEQTFGGSAALSNLSDHQRDSAAYAQAMWVHRAWTLIGSARMDWFQNYDGNLRVWNGSGWAPAPVQPAQLDQRVFDPRLGLARKLGSHWSLSASGFRAFRAPTPSELYRSTQVGNQLTLPDGSLECERATGWETGVATERRWMTVRAAYFDTQINRPIAAVTINAKSSPILLERENLGQIESRGVSADAMVAPLHWLSMDGGYQYAHATVTRGAQDVGNWIPEVARNMATINLRAARSRLGTLALQSRLSGHQFDDDANTYLLHGYFRLDAYGSHDFGEHVTVFAAGENLFDRTIEVAKTPTSTLASARVLRVGVSFGVGHNRDPIK